MIAEHDIAVAFACAVEASRRLNGAMVSISAFPDPHDTGLTHALELGGVPEFLCDGSGRPWLCVSLRPTDISLPVSVRFHGPLLQGPIVRPGCFFKSDPWQPRRMRPTNSELSEPTHGGPVTFREAKAEILATGIRAYLTDLMERHHGNVAAAAEEADMDRSNLRRSLRQNNIHYPRARPRHWRKP